MLLLAEVGCAVPGLVGLARCGCRCGHGVPVGGGAYRLLLLWLEGHALATHGVWLHGVLLLGGGHEHACGVKAGRALQASPQLGHGQLIRQGQAKRGHDQVVGGAVGVLRGALRTCAVVGGELLVLGAAILVVA